MTRKLVISLLAAAKLKGRLFFGIRVHFRDGFVYVNDTHKWNYAVEAMGIRSDI